ncbi:hypothetical protein H5410_012049 [Solanum commersonii]|uniref:Uncharacterized protein n=1 Tax=Solanum commersonii TaxID=4109 RepID=A0A9J6ARR9_SOLCO|nr:hypothetical protein H5410_012049 [Solanum commersonii]
MVKTGKSPKERWPAEMEEMREKEVTMASSPAYTMLFTTSPFHGSFGLPFFPFPFSNSPSNDLSNGALNPPLLFDSAIFSDQFTSTTRSG